MNRIGFALLAIASVSSAFAQPVAFEVASVKLSTPPIPGKGLLVRGCPGSSDPGLVTMDLVNVLVIDRMEKSPAEN